jgi:hypothetical protein
MGSLPGHPSEGIPVPQTGCRKGRPYSVRLRGFGLITFHTEADGHAASLEWWVNLFTRTDEDVAS